VGILIPVSSPFPVPLQPLKNRIEWSLPRLPRLEDLVRTPHIQRSKGRMDQGNPIHFPSFFFMTSHDNRRFTLLPQAVWLSSVGGPDPVSAPRVLKSFFEPSFSSFNPHITAQIVFDPPNTSAVVSTHSRWRDQTLRLDFHFPRPLQVSQGNFKIIQDGSQGPTPVPCDEPFAQLHNVPPAG